MLLAEARCMFIGFILYISGVHGQEKISSLHGSSVELPCSAENHTASNKWYTVHRNGSTFVQNELSADRHHVAYNMSEDSQPMLTINNLTESDANVYCCRENIENPELCWQSSVQLSVLDLQVKVIPASEGQTVTLMCSTSWPLTKDPEEYIWYKNGELLYKERSPLYRELVSSEKSVRYSCAIKSKKELRAPEVSVDSVTSTCFSVTYDKGKMCSYQQKSEDEPCSITYPREVHVQRTSPVTLNCTTSCPVTDPQTSFSWYQNTHLRSNSVKQILEAGSSNDSFSCAIKGLEHMMSPEVCTKDKMCWIVNYDKRRICALEGSSVNISTKYSYPDNEQPKSKSWYKMKRSGEEKLTDRVKYHENMKNHHTLQIDNLKIDDSGEYTFRLQQDNERWKQSNFPGVTLVVTGLRLKFQPENPIGGERVTLTCHTKCPLPANTTYIWYWNKQHKSESKDNYLILEKVRSQDSGNYSCAVEIGKRKINSSERTLTVHSTREITAAAVGAGAALLVTVPIIVFLCIRTKRTSGQSPTTEATDNREQLNLGHVYENIPARPAEQDGLYYSTIHFSESQTDPLYSTVQPRQPKQQEHVAYAVVNIGPV